MRSFVSRKALGMADDTPQKGLLQEMLQLLKRFQAGGNLAAIEDRGEWDELVESKRPEERELLKELARFSDLWRYFQDRKEKLGPEVVSAIRQLHKLRT